MTAWMITPDGERFPQDEGIFSTLYGIRVDDDGFDWQRYAVQQLGCAMVTVEPRAEGVTVWVNAMRLDARMLAPMLEQLPIAANAYALDIEWCGRLRERYPHHGALVSRLMQLVDVDLSAHAPETTMREIDPHEAIHPAIYAFHAEIRRSQWQLHDLSIMRLRRQGLWDRVLLFCPERMVYEHVGRAFDRLFGAGWAAANVGASVRDRTPNPDYCRTVTGLNTAFVGSGERCRTMQLDVPNVWATDPNQPTLRLTYEKTFARVETPTGRTLIAKFTQSHLPLLHTQIAR